MKTPFDHYRLFFYSVLLATFVVGSLGAVGQKWAQSYKPLAQFFVGVIMICVGPSSIAGALHGRATEEGTLWKKTWPATLIGGILFPIGGVAMLWKLFAG